MTSPPTSARTHEKKKNRTQALRIISEDHSNMWRLATTIDHVAGEIEDGAQVDPAFFNAVFDYIEQFVDRFHHPREDDCAPPTSGCRTDPH